MMTPREKLNIYMRGWKDGVNGKEQSNKVKIKTKPEIASLYKEGFKDGDFAAYFTQKIIMSKYANERKNK